MNKTEMIDRIVKLKKEINRIVGEIETALEWNESEYTEKFISVREDQVEAIERKISMLEHEIGMI